MNIEDKITGIIQSGIHELYGSLPGDAQIQLQKTRKEFTGDFTLVVFPLLKISKQSPEKTAEDLGNFLLNNSTDISGFNVIKGFLNLSLHEDYWKSLLVALGGEKEYGKIPLNPGLPSVMVEFSSPNTNKPLHLGHIRNNLLGDSISRILEASGRRVIRVNLVNDRGIHICKSMLAWKKYGNGETPESTGKKGDHLVGDFYVKFDQEYKKEIGTLMSEGLSKDEAEQKSSLMSEAREMLRLWENGDEEINSLWKTMNSWVYEGFDETYKNLGVTFDRIYYESNTYRLGKQLVEDGLKKGILEKREDNSIWADLTGDGLDNKLLLRSDGTSVYMTQDLGTAHQRFTEYDIDRHIYVVGNEQNYHFQVLKIILKKLGFDWADNIYHLSYGMVELPEGKMKSREGTVVDADDLIAGMISTAREMSDELGKLGEIPDDDKEMIFNQVGLGALKYFILKVDPKKNMTFNPSESIDFNGNTGPFIQYTHARIRSVMRKAEENQVTDNFKGSYKISEKELSLIRLLYEFPSVVQSSALEMNPALIANYMYDVAREFNQFYHDHSILNAGDRDVVAFRLSLAKSCGLVIKSGMDLLGIEVPERM